MSIRLLATLATALLAACAAPTTTPPAAPAPQGEIKGTAWEHTAASRAGVLARAQVALPASSGLGLKAIEEWQRWLASLGIASVAPDSFALPDHVTYKSPIDKASYERIHSLRASEIDIALEGLRQARWVDGQRLVLAGTSEGGVPVARYTGNAFAGRVIYSWSCEDNYFVTQHRSALPTTQPVLNVMSATDVFFSPSNPWLGKAGAQGHCGAAMGDNKNATVVLIPGAPHTLLNLPAARFASAGFLRELLKP